MTKIRNQQQLIDAAAKVFADKGYDAARLEDIAAELGVLQGSLYYHVGSKAGLLRLLRVRRFEDITASIGAIANGPGTAVEKLRSATTTHLRFLEMFLGESPTWFRRLGDPKRSEAQQAEDEVLTGRYRDCWKAILRSGMESGEVRADLDLNIAVLQILGILNWTSIWYDPLGRCSMDDVAEAHLRMILAGVASPVS